MNANHPSDISFSSRDRHLVHDAAREAAVRLRSQAIADFWRDAATMLKHVFARRQRVTVAGESATSAGVCVA